MKKLLQISILAKEVASCSYNDLNKLNYVGLENVIVGIHGDISTLSGSKVEEKKATKN